MNRKILGLIGVWIVALVMTTNASMPMAQVKKKPVSAFYTQINLVSSTKSLKAKFHDKNLLNPWGLVQGQTPFWVSDNNAGVSTLYEGTGKAVLLSPKVPFVVTVPPPMNSTSAAATPSGIVFNGVAADFTGDLFIFATEDGTISGWQPADGTEAVRHVDNSENPTALTGAVYKGLAIATMNGNQFIYATNFRSGTIDVFDGGYNQVTLTGTFTDPNPIPGFAPFGITLFGNNLWVTYAMQDTARHDPIHQPGAGYIDIFTTDGVFQARFATGGKLNAPWGMALAPANFGPFSNDYWIGNFGDGMINVFDTGGNFADQPIGPNYKPLNVDGLWALVFGDGSNGASQTSLYFTAGPKMESEGLFGEFEASGKSSSGALPGNY